MTNNFKPFRSRNAEKEKKQRIIEDIKHTKACLDAAYQRFDIECDSDLTDSIIYEIQSLRAKHRFLIRLAKEEEIECGEISVFR